MHSPRLPALAGSLALDPPAVAGADDARFDDREVAHGLRSREECAGVLLADHRFENRASGVYERDLSTFERPLWRRPEPVGDLALLRMDRLPGGKTGDEEPGVTGSALDIAAG